MALFNNNNETREEKLARKQQEMLNKYGMTSLTDPQDIESVKKIVEELAGTGLMDLGAKLGGGSEKDMLKLNIYYQRAILEQNFIMIRQLDRISKLLDK